MTGKKASRQQQCLEVFLALLEEQAGPQDPLDMLLHVWRLDRRPAYADGVTAKKLVSGSRLGRTLTSSGCGQYTRLMRLMTCLMPRVQIDRDLLDTADREALCSLPGVGLKTSSFFLLHSRTGAEIACLDTHVLKYMRDNNLHPNVPDSSPSGCPDLYFELEQAWLQHAHSLGRLSRDLDFEVWKRYSGY